MTKPSKTVDYGTNIRLVHSAGTFTAEVTWTPSEWNFDRTVTLLTNGSGGITMQEDDHNGVTGEAHYSHTCPGGNCGPGQYTAKATFNYRKPIDTKESNPVQL